MTIKEIIETYSSSVAVQAKGFFEEAGVFN
uniref:Uncharacterized protein n=1 Tax=Anguilla anguilla TaxID=7936 RepID=A0A0E9TQY7_ANGAN